MTGKFIVSVWACAMSLSAFGPAYAAPIPAASDRLQGLNGELNSTRAEILRVEKHLLEVNEGQAQARNQIAEIRRLTVLQKREREISKKRLMELEHFVSELEDRRTHLSDKILAQRMLIRRALIEIERSIRKPVQALPIPSDEAIEAPRRKVLSRLVDRNIKEVEALKADLQDSEILETRIEEERQQMAYLVQDLQEQESLLELNRQLQLEVLKKRHAERLAQLATYRKLKKAELQIEDLMREFNARVEFEKLAEREREATSAMMQSEFVKLKGKLALPVRGKILSEFGRHFEPNSRLYVFKKGIDLGGGRNEPVQSVASGKVVYSGVLPGYRKVAIVDHGAHYYSLYAHLGQLSRKVGQYVGQGDELGQTDDNATPIYFEIRAHNVAVNPLQWISN